jgi:hypothetical protein
MSEESKTNEGDYIMMGGGGAGVPPGRIGTAVNGGTGTGAGMTPFDDPNLSQEEKDHRLAIALQQQENAAAFQQHQMKHDEYEKAKEFRTARSATHTKLQAIRQKDHGMLMVPPEYTNDHAYVKTTHDGKMTNKPGSPSSYAPPPHNATPQELADYKLAMELQKVEQVGAGTVREMEKIVHEEAVEEEAQAHRTERSNYHINQKGFMKH